RSIDRVVSTTVRLIVDCLGWQAMGVRVKPGWSLRVRRFRRWLPGAAALLVALILLGAGLWWFRPVETASGMSIAVLPFDNYGGQGATPRPATGRTEAIIPHLRASAQVD